MSSYTLEGIQPCQCTTLAGVAVLLSTAQCNVDRLSGPPKTIRTAGCSGRETELSTGISQKKKG